MFLVKESKEQAHENPGPILVLSLSHTSYYFSIILPEFAVWDTTSSTHHLIHSTVVLPISLHRQPCLLHLQSQRPGPCPSSVFRTLTSRQPSSSFSSILHLRRVCLGGCWSSALLWSQRPFHPLYSPLREVVFANASHRNWSWASKHFLKHSTEMSYGPWKLRESRGSMQFICALVPQSLFSLLYY